ALDGFATMRRPGPSVEHQVEVPRVLDPEAMVGAPHRPDALGRGRPLRGAEVRGQALVRFHAQLIQDVVDAPEVQVEGRGTDADGPGKGRRRDPVSARAEM